MKKVAFISFILRENIEFFVYYLIIRNNNINSIWDIFKYIFIWKYENLMIYKDLFQDKFKVLYYYESLCMMKFYEKFRFIEI